MAKLHDVKRIAAIDPGRDKCGMAVLAEDGKVLLQKVIETRRLEQELRQGKLRAGNPALGKRDDQRPGTEPHPRFPART